MLALLVEDDADVAEVLEHHLSRLGFEARTVPSGEAAVEMLDLERWDLVVVDILLPGIDGRELLRHMHERPSGRHAAVLITSILGSYELDQIEADARLPKPFRSADITRAVDEALARAAGRAPGETGEG